VVEFESITHRPIRLEQKGEDELVDHVAELRLGGRHEGDNGLELLLLGKEEDPVLPGALVLAEDLGKQASRLFVFAC
jgi:hypothetical protein